MVQEQVQAPAEGMVPEGAESEGGTQEQFDPGAVFEGLDDSQREAVAKHVMAQEELRRAAIATDEAQSEINRTADKRLRPHLSQLSELRREIAAIKDGQQQTSQQTQRQADEALVAQWNGMTAEQRMEQMGSDMPLRVARANERLQAPVQQQQTPQQSGGEDATMAAVGAEFIWALKAHPGFDGLSDDEYQQVVNAEAAKLDLTDPQAAFRGLVSGVNRAADERWKKRQAAQQTQEGNQNLQRQGRPITGAQRGAAAGTVAYFEQKIADPEKHGQMSDKDWIDYMKLREERGMN